jgi:hypothetical protein
MADLIRSLRNLSDQPYRIGGPTCDTIAEAADEIEQLRGVLNECLIILDDGDYGEDPELRQLTDKVRAVLSVKDTIGKADD